MADGAGAEVGGMDMGGMDMGGMDMPGMGGDEGGESGAPGGMGSPAIVGASKAHRVAAIRKVAHQEETSAGCSRGGCNIDAPVKIVKRGQWRDDDVLGS